MSNCLPRLSASWTLNQNESCALEPKLVRNFGLALYQISLVAPPDLNRRRCIDLVCNLTSIPSTLLYGSQTSISHPPRAITFMMLSKQHDSLLLKRRFLKAAAVLLTVCSLGATAWETKDQGKHSILQPLPDPRY